MSQEHSHFMDEADIGSGEKNAGQHDVERDVRAVHGTKQSEALDGSHHDDVTDEQRYAQQRPPSPAPQAGNDDGQDSAPSRVLQSGTHLARIVVPRQPDGTFEAQVYVRLTREPEVAETYIPAGTFGTQTEAWAAAEDRAKRAFSEHEF